jgi:hypothetical protein
MSSYITRQEQFEASTFMASKSNAASRRRAYDEVETDSESDDEKNFVSTMFPPRKKARHTKDDSNGNVSFEIKTWLASMGDFFKSALGMQRDTTKKESKMTTPKAFTATPANGSVKETTPTNSAEKTPTTKETPKKSKTPRTADKKPRKPRRCVSCRDKHRDEMRATTCPGKMSRNKCTILKE